MSGTLSKFIRRGHLYNDKDQAMSRSNGFEDEKMFNKCFNKCVTDIELSSYTKKPEEFNTWTFEFFIDNVINNVHFKRWGWPTKQKKETNKAGNSNDESMSRLMFEQGSINSLKGKFSLNKQKTNNIMYI